MTVKLPKMSKSEIEELIRQQTICRIAFKGDAYPYMAPFQYVVIDGKMYFHFTDYGKKMRLLEKDDRVCVGLESFKPDLSEYKFVVLRGRLKIVDDPEERSKAIQKLAEEGSKKISTNFLAAHGLDKKDGWKSFTSEKSFVIIKLDQLKDEIGLKSH